MNNNDLYRYIHIKDLNTYEKDNKVLSYYNLFYKDDALILCNNIADDWEYLELQNNYDDEDFEIFQYYIIGDDLANRLMRYTNEIIYYHNRLDIYILGVTHYGTSWHYIPTQFELIQLEDDENWYKAVRIDEDDEDDEDEDDN